VTVRNLIVDGNRRELGRFRNNNLATGLIVLGGNEGPTVKDCQILDPRGYTAIHVREGDKLSCSGAIIEKNVIGPVGEEFDERIDGPDPEMSLLGRPLADGVSLACRDSFVRDNTFFDNTDAAVVVYCSPGSHITRNTIESRSLSAMAGILAVDVGPFDGDYTNTIISSNTINALHRSIRVAIGLGPSVWSDDTDSFIKGGTVIENKFKGEHMGFGIAAAGLDGWKILDNKSTAKHSGKKTDRCFDEPINPEPMAFLKNDKIIKASKLQPEFVDQEFAYGE
jgi:hypothetical protein